jgi:polysaccharide transporter, PST family
MLKKILNRYLIPFHPGLVKILSNTGWMISEKIIRMSVGIYVTVWVARYLGPEVFGLFSFILAISALFSMLSTLGIEQIVVRDFVRKPEKSNEILGTAFMLKFMGAFLSLIFSVTTIYYFREGDSLTVLMVGIVSAATVFQSFDVIDLNFKARVEARYPSIAKSIAFLLMSLLKVLLIIINAPLIAFAWAVFGEVALSAVFLVIAYKIKGFKIKGWQFRVVRAKKLLVECWPLAISGVAVMIYMKIDQVMLGQLVGDRAVGLYSAAIKLSEVWYIVPVAIMNSAAPAITRSFSSDLNQYHARLQKLFNLTTLIAFMLAVPTTILSSHIIEIIYGKEFLSSSPILAIHIWGSIFVGWGLIKELLLVTEGLVKVTLITTVTGAAFNIILNLILIPMFQGQGAAIATLFSQLISASLTLLFFRNARKIVKMQFKSLFRFFDFIPD